MFRGLCVDRLIFGAALVTAIVGGAIIPELQGLLADRIGIHHAFMGYYLAKEWLLPEPVCQSVLWHHDFPALRDGRADIPASCAKLISLALVADHVYCTHAMGVACHEWSEHGEYALETLGIALFTRVASDDPTALIGLPLIALCDMLAAEGVALLQPA